MACRASLDTVDIFLLTKNTASRNTRARSESGVILQQGSGKKGIGNLKVECTVFPKSRRMVEIPVQNEVMRFRFRDLSCIQVVPEEGLSRTTTPIYQKHT